MTVLYRRLAYMLTPQLSIYENLAPLINKDDHVLEVGFGTGMGTIQYAYRAKKVVAIEIDGELVKFADRVLPIQNVSWEVGDICKEGLGSYDVIVMIEVIEHIPHWQHALQTCYDRLLPGGRMIISTPNANGTFIKNKQHGDEWTAQEFKERLKNYFRSVRLYDFSLKNEMDTNTRITPLVAVCEK